MDALTRAPIIPKGHVFIAKHVVKVWLPFGGLLRRVKRHYFGYQPAPWNIDFTIEDIAGIYALMRKNGHAFRGTVLEVGTGWFPIAGIIMRLAGAERVLLTDIIPYMDQQAFLTARQIVLDRLDTIAPLFDFPPGPARALLAHVGKPEDLGMIYHVPFELGVIADGSVDVIMSRACLEHIEEAELRVLMAGLRPKLRPGGVMGHSIDNDDHISHIDPIRNRLAFLTRSPGTHRLISRLMKGGENRLRHHEYAGIFRQAGYDIISDEASTPDDVVRSVRELSLAAPYDKMTPEQLAAVKSWFLLQAK